MTAVFAPNTGKAIVQNPTVQVTVNYLLDIRTVKAILPLKPVLINLLERLKWSSMHR
jgi:hypothetical protein